MHCRPFWGERECLTRSDRSESPVRCGGPDLRNTIDILHCSIIIIW